MPAKKPPLAVCDSAAPSTPLSPATARKRALEDDESIQASSAKRCKSGSVLGDTCETIADKDTDWVGERLLSLNSMVYSMENQKAFIRRGKRVRDTEMVLQCLEFETGFDSTLDLSGELVLDKAVDEFFSGEAEKRGARSTCLTSLPPSWDEGGAAFSILTIRHLQRSTFSLTPSTC